MSLNLLDNLDYKGPKPDFNRQQYANYEEMKNAIDSRLPPLYITYCLQDGKVYLYKKNNEIDPITGRFRQFPENDFENFQKDVMPAASSVLAGKIYQYIGESNLDFVNGFFYQCVLDSGSGMYYWEAIDTCELDSITTHEIDVLFQQGE